MKKKARLSSLVKKKVKQNIFEDKNCFQILLFYIKNVLNTFYGIFFRNIVLAVKFFQQNIFFLKYAFIVSVSSLVLYYFLPIITTFGSSMSDFLFIRNDDVNNYFISNIDFNLKNIQFARSNEYRIDFKNQSFYENSMKSIQIPFDIKVKKKDFRAYVFDEYFKANNSPLYGMGSFIVEKCIEYNAPADCMIIVSIAQAETNLCKYLNSAEMFNCWGFGGAGVNRIRFSSFEEAISRVYNVLVYQYGRRYILNPPLMQSTYCGTPEIDPNCVYWGNNVLSAQYQLNSFATSLGFPSLYSLR